jgi:hypothetical protein
MCDNWEEARKLKPAKLRFAPCPKKFASVNKYDTNLIHVALKDYTEKGTGKYRDQAERTAFRNEVLNICKTSPKPSGGTRVVGSVNREERCNSGQVEIIPHKKQNEHITNGRFDAELETESDSSCGTKLIRLATQEERC